MKASELRLGNWILPGHHLDGHYHFVEQLDAGIINHYTEDWYSPIPLTPEILEKCGFEKDENLGGFIDFIKNGVVLQIDWTEKQIKKLKDFSVRFERKGDSVEIKYLHQLQNLFFAITGNELNITL